MLRVLKINQNRAILSAFQITTTVTPSIVADIGSQSLASVTRAGVGQAQLVPKIYGNLDPLMAVGIGANIADGGAGVVNSSYSRTNWQFEANNASGSLDDGTFDAIILSQRGRGDVRSLAQDVFATSHRARLVPLKIDGTGTASIVIGKSQATLVDNGTGDYTITFRNKFARTPVIVPCLNQATMGAARITAKSNTGFTLKTFNTSGVAADAIVNLFVYGWDSAAENGLWRKSELLCPMRQGCLFGFKATATAGPTYTLGQGGEHGTISRTGVGTFRLTYKRAFRKEPIILATGINSFRAQVIGHQTVSSASGVTMYTATDFAVTNFAGAAQEQSAMILGVGSYDNFNY